tara:strand:- start:1702 stop:1956 length:255 start_codon:yes stop_codon:yes gene_type:complete
MFIGMSFPVDVSCSAGASGLHEPYRDQAERQLNGIPPLQQLRQITQGALRDIFMIHVLMKKKPGDCGAGLSYRVTLVSIRRGAD